MVATVQSTPSTATSLFHWRLRTNWVQRVRRQLIRT